MSRIPFWVATRGVKYRWKVMENKINMNENGVALLRK